MERVTEYYPGEQFRTRVWITDLARKEMEKEVHTDLGAFFRISADKGLPQAGNSIHPEGDGIVAYGKRTWTTRITGYFHPPNGFIVCGVYSGKPGKRGRPERGDHVVSRACKIKKEGVEFVQSNQSATQ